MVLAKDINGKCNMVNNTFRNFLSFSKQHEAFTFSFSQHPSFAWCGENINK